MTSRTKQEAREILQGVIDVANNEMLVHGTYITGQVISQELAEAGAMCGGRQACLIGTVALASTDSYEDADELVAEILRTEGTDEPVENAATQLALDVLDAESLARLEGDYSSSAVLARNWAHPCEGYFEDYLAGRPYNETREAIIELATGAMARL